LDHSALDNVCTNRIGTVEDYEFLSGFVRNFGGERHCPHVGVHSRADVLDVIDEDIDAVEHSSCGDECFSVKRVYRHAGFAIDSRAYSLASNDVSPDPMLRREQCNEADTGRLMKQVDGASSLLVPPGLIGDESDAFSSNQVR